MLIRVEVRDHHRWPCRCRGGGAEGNLIRVWEPPINNLWIYGIVGQEDLGVTEATEAVLEEAVGALLPHLDERQRRLALGAAARVLG